MIKSFIRSFDDTLEKWEIEAQKEKEALCRKYKHECYDCPMEENCEYEDLLNSLEEW